MGEEEDGSVQCYLTQKKKMKLKVGRELLRREKEENVCELCDYFFYLTGGMVYLNVSSSL